MPFYEHFIGRKIDAGDGGRAKGGQGRVGVVGQYTDIILQVLPRVHYTNWCCLAVVPRDYLAFCYILLLPIFVGALN